MLPIFTRSSKPFQLIPFADRKDVISATASAFVVVQCGNVSNPNSQSPADRNSSSDMASGGGLFSSTY